MSLTDGPEGEPELRRTRASKRRAKRDLIFHDTNEGRDDEQSDMGFSDPPLRPHKSRRKLTDLSIRRFNSPIRPHLTIRKEDPGQASRWALDKGQFLPILEGKGEEADQRSL